MVKKKPYYLREPWEILFKGTKLEKIHPWNIDLVYLLKSLLEEMERAGVDFRVAGTALYSSVLIYLKKAELLHEIEKPPKESNLKKDVYIPPPLSLPFRLEFTTTTVADLISALEKALAEERPRKVKSKLPVLPIPIPDFMEMDAYLLEIEERADILLNKIREMNLRDGYISIFDILKDQHFLEIVRAFMMLLFLAQKGEIDLLQDEDESDIKIIAKESDEN